MIDPANQAEHQLLTLVAADEQQGAVEAKAAALGAQVTVEDDDFCAPPMSQGAYGSRGTSYPAARPPPATTASGGLPLPPPAICTVGISGHEPGHALRPARSRSERH